MSTSEAELPKIVLLGDLALHTMVVRETDRKDGDSMWPFRGYRREASKPLLPTMIKEALQDGLLAEAGVMDAIRPDYEKSCRELSDLPTLCGEIISVLDNFPAGSSARKDVRDTLRVQSSYFLAPELNPADRSEFAQKCSKTLADLLTRVEQSKLEPSHMLVLYDHGAFLRTALSQPRPSQADLQKIRNLVTAASAGVVIGINSDLADLAWLESAMGAVETTRARTIVQLTADGLRKAGLNITKYGALEETVADIFGQRDKPPLNKLLKLSDHLVVVFSETGGLYLRQAGGQLSGSLHFCPNFDRIAQSDPRTFGAMPGKFSIFLVALVKELYRAAQSQTEWKLGGAVRLGAVAYNRHFSAGLGPSSPLAENQPFDPFVAFASALSKPTCGALRRQVKNRDKRALLVSSLDFDEKKQADWRRTAGLFNKAPAAVDHDLASIVKRGLDATFVRTDEDWKRINPADDNGPWFPESYITVPYAAMGKLRLLDHIEIARHYSLAKVIRKYIETIDWKTPLSIAVFGRPGSGKSFGVKQIIDTVDPGRKSQPLTFNLAQFSSVDQLTEAFHQIQDRALSSEEVPLAIFDEFDAHFGTQFGWLKYFLAPMQDGVFRGKTGDYKVGRAIFLFAGGTSDSYDRFREPLKVLGLTGGSAEKFVRDDTSPSIDISNSGIMTPHEVRASKLADFTSRLRGFLDIADVNEKGVGTVVSGMLKLRRAVILRSLLEEHAKPIFIFSHEDHVKQARIHDDVIHYFLNQTRYVNGVRSMEAIIQMSRWIDDEYVAASLPTHDMLRSHVGSGESLINPPAA